MSKKTVLLPANPAQVTEALQALAAAQEACISAKSKAARETAVAELTRAARAYQALVTRNYLYARASAPARKQV